MRLLFASLAILSDSGVDSTPFDKDDFISKIFPNGMIDFVIQLLGFVVLLLIVFFIAYKPVHNLIKRRRDYIEGNLRESEASLARAKEAESHKEETIPERFVKETPAGFISDDFSDEIALSIRTGKGLAVIVGCSHPGIMNMVDEIRRSSDEDIYALFGGTHLVEADDKRIESSLSGLTGAGAKVIGMCHCSGLHAEEMAKNELGSIASGLSVGDTAIIE